MSKSPTTTIFIDKYHPKADGKCAVSVRVTYERVKRYYPTKYKLTPADFEKLFTKSPREPYKTILQALHSEEKRAIKIIDDLNDKFNFPLFEKKYARKTGDSDNLFVLLEERANELRHEERISTAVTFECALNSLKKYWAKEKLLLEELTADFLNGYKKWMLDNDNSTATIGIYLRNVRTIFNEAIGDDASLRDLYPFGKGKGKFNIPTGKNIKKALSLADIANIYNYKPRNESEERAKDFWLLSYLANGINVKDISLLKFENIDGDLIRFQRAKTSRANEGNPVIITFSITSDIRRILDRWGNKSSLKDSYIFPILEKGLTAQEIYDRVQLFVAFVNNNMKKITGELNISANTTTYVARHSFSTILKNSGVSVVAISEALGHGSIKTTQNYLAGFEDDAKRKLAVELTNFSKLKAV